MYSKGNGMNAYEALVQYDGYMGVGLWAKIPDIDGDWYVTDWHRIWKRYKRDQSIDAFVADVEECYAKGLLDFTWGVDDDVNTGEVDEKGAVIYTSEAFVEVDAVTDAREIVKNMADRA